MTIMAQKLNGWFLMLMVIHVTGNEKYNKIGNDATA